MFQSITSTAPIQEPHPSRPDLSVIIVTWNVRELVLRCISALFSDASQSNITIEVIVVDNGSQDGTVAALRHLPVTLIENRANLGYGRANNIGMKAAKGRHFLVLNPDTIPTHGALQTLFRFGKTHPRAGIVAPRLLNPDGSVQTAAFAFPTLAMALLDLFPLPKLIPGRLRYRLAHSRLSGRYPREARKGKPFRIGHPLGACLLIRREAYEECGGFDERIFMYSEEIDLALRFASKGWECWQVPSARVTHLGGQSVKQMADTMFVELWRSRLYIYRKHYGPVSYSALAGLVTVAMRAEIASARLASLLGQRRDRARTRKARAILKMVYRK